MICPKCDKVLTSNDQKYHLECIQCPLCTVTQPSQYEYNGTSYCRIHYSLIPETHCSGCDQAILKQFVEHVDLPNQIWHPECYMIYKFWSIKLNIMPPTQGKKAWLDRSLQL
jgi:phage FluMu protein Com